MKAEALQKMLLDASRVIGEQTVKIAQLEKENANVKRELSTKQAELNQHERKQECEKLANLMIDKGLINPSDFQAEVKKYMGSRDDINLLMKAAELVEVKDATIDFVGGDSSMHKTADQIFEEKLLNMR